MKNYLLCITIIVFTVLSSCSDKKLADGDVPQPAKTSFTAKYPGATDLEWIKEKKGDKTLYEAQFKLNGKKIEAEFDADGNFIAED